MFPDAVCSVCLSPDGGEKPIEIVPFVWVCGMLSLFYKQEGIGIYWYIVKPSRTVTNTLMAGGLAASCLDWTEAWIRLLHVGPVQTHSHSFHGCKTETTPPTILFSISFMQTNSSIQKPPSLSSTPRPLLYAISQTGMEQGNVHLLTAPLV